MDAPCAGTGRTRARLRNVSAQAASGSPRTHADDARARAVRQLRSTREAAEQSRGTGCGGGGGKGAGEGEPARAKHAPNAESEERAQCARAGTQQRSRMAGSGSPRSYTTFTIRSDCARPTSI